MFRRLHSDVGATVVIQFDGQEIKACPQDSIAAALLASGIRSLRHTAVSGSPRAPYCMMGSCYECLVQIDGISVQACMHKVENGLIVERIISDVTSDELNDKTS